jgi:hypothetical protein
MTVTARVGIVTPRRYARFVTIMHWNGDDVPDELRALPAGTYVVQPAEELTALSPEEEAGLVAALESVRAGKGIEHEAVRARVQRIVRP